jgi:hypothetical protein
MRCKAHIRESNMSGLFKGSEIESWPPDGVGQSGWRAHD